MKRSLDVLCFLIFIGIGPFLFNDNGRSVFIRLTSMHPVIMGFIKFSILATLGELLIKRIVLQKWIIKGGSWFKRAFMWGCLGVLLTYVFPIYSAGVDSLIERGMLPVFSSQDMFLISSAFWKSFWMNILFAFPMMVGHRITDTLIDRGRLFSKWPFMDVWAFIDWKNMWGFVAPSILWFWIPAHTLTFCLPAEYRIIMAASLSIFLGAILAFAKMRSKNIN